MDQRFKGRGDCQTCRYFIDDPHQLEREFVGVLALSSTYGSSRGDSGICTVRDTFQYPLTGCSLHRPRVACFRQVAADVT